MENNKNFDSSLSNKKQKNIIGEGNCMTLGDIDKDKIDTLENNKNEEEKIPENEKNNSDLENTNQNNEIKNEEKINFVITEKIKQLNNLIESNENLRDFTKINIEKDLELNVLTINLLDFLMNFQKNYCEKIEEKNEFEMKSLELELYLKELTSKCEDLNKYIDVLYKSIHSILILSDSTKEKTNIIKCEPVPSYLRFINNTIN